MDKEKLRNYRNMQIEIHLMENRILAIQNKMNSPRYKVLNGNLNVSNASNDNPNVDMGKESREIIGLRKTLDSLILDIEDKCRDINRLLSKCKKQIKDLEKKLEQLESIDRTVITLYYIDCIKQNGEARTWNDVANLVSYSLRRTQDIHKRAIGKLMKM